MKSSGKLFFKLNFLLLAKFKESFEDLRRRFRRLKALRFAVIQSKTRFVVDPVKDMVFIGRRLGNTRKESSITLVVSRSNVMDF
jgi:hypothetical protein